MTEVLDQSDIDALLRAAAQGDVNPPSEQTHQQIFSRYRNDREQVEIRDYDFKRPERISKDQMRALQTLHEAFARNFGAAVSGFLRTIVEVRVAHAEQMTYAEFISSLPNPTSFNLIESEQLDGRLCLEISPLIIYPIIDRLLGGSSQDLFIPQRALTAIEGRLVKQILARALTGLSEAWEGIRQIEFKLGEMESNPHIVQIVPPNEVVVVIGFEIKMGSRAGTMSLCIPFNVIEPLIDDLSAQSWFMAGRSRGERKWQETIVNDLAEAPLQAEAIIARTTITVGDLRNLEVGDIITTSRPASEPVVLAIDGKPKFLALIGQHKGRRAIRIVRPKKPADRY